MPNAYTKKRINLNHPSHVTNPIVAVKYRKHNKERKKELQLPSPFRAEYMLELLHFGFRDIVFF